MTTRSITLHLVDRVRTGQSPSALAPPAGRRDVDDRAKSRIVAGPFAQRACTDVVGLETPLSTLPPTPAAWAEHDDARLIGFIVERYHRPLREELPRLQELAAHVVGVDDAGRRLVQLVADLSQLLIEHLDEEEQALFPAILDGGAPVMGLAGAARDDHQVVLRLLSALQQQSAACPTSDPVGRAFVFGLQTLERELVDHIALEARVLWPRLRQTEATQTH